MLDVLDGRSRPIVARYLRGLSDAERRAIQVVSIDPMSPTAPRSGPSSPTRGSWSTTSTSSAAPNTALDTVRRDRQRQAASRIRRGSRQADTAGWRQDLFRARHRLLRARERLTLRQRQQLCELFAREPLIAEAWGLKEAFRSIYRASDRREAERRLDAFLAAVDRAQIPAFAAFAKGLRPWREELLAYFDQPTTNGYAEGVINKIKVIKRRAYGLPTFHGFRKRVVIACG